MEGKFIIGLMFLFLSTMSCAQKNQYIPPDWEQKTHSFVLPELQIDSTFIENLHNILFDKNCRVMKSKISNHDKSWQNFLIRFEKKDSLIYSMEVSLLDIPAENSIGFFEYNKYLYWFGGDTPPNIILEKKSKKRFSYKEPIPAPYDPLFWYLMYDIQTGSIELKEKNFIY